MTPLETAILQSLAGFAASQPLDEPFNIDAGAAREKLAQHLAGNLAMRDMALAQELARALLAIEEWVDRIRNVRFPNNLASIAMAQTALIRAREEGIIP